MYQSTVIILGFMSFTAVCQPNIKPPVGSVAIIADGNSPDPDDLAGTATIYRQQKVD